MKKTLALAFAACCFSVIEAKSHLQIELDSLDKLGRTLVSGGCIKQVLVKKIAIKNQLYPEVIDEIKEYRCPTFKITKYIAKAVTPFKVLPLKAEVSVGNSQLPKRYAIGASVSEVERALGIPSKRNSITYELEVVGPSGNTITFTHHQDKITSVAWSWDVW